MMTKETHKSNDTNLAISKWRDGEATFNSRLLELGRLPGCPTIKANKSLYQWRQNQRKRMKKAIVSFEQNDSPVDCDDIVEYLRDRQARLENVC